MLNSKQKKVAGIGVFGLGVAALAGVGVAGYAATLGGVGAQQVGADQVLISSCDTDGVSTLTQESTTAIPGSISITGINVMGINTDCDGQDIRLAVYDQSLNNVANYSGTLSLQNVNAGSGESGVLTLDAPLTAETYGQLSVRIQGW